MRKILLALFFTAILASCSSDNDGSDVVSENIDYYIEESRSFTSSILTSHDETRYDLLDGKQFSTTGSNSGTPHQTHFYTNGLLTTSRELMTGHYSYDGQQLVAMEYYYGDNPPNYRRFINVTDNVSYVEVLTLAYDDPETQVTRRIIVEFDAADNVIAVGEDANFDGVMDAVNQYSYQGEDLVEAQFANGDHFTCAYSDIVNNLYVVRENTYGKRNRRLIYIEHFLQANSLGTFYWRHISQNSAANDSYDVLSNGFYKRHHSEFTIGDMRNELTTTFYFK